MLSQREPPRHRCELGCSDGRTTGELSLPAVAVVGEPLAAVSERGMGRLPRRPCRAAVHLLLAWGLPCLWALDNGVGDVPAMGWNSWNQFRCDINEGLIREVARAMVSSGLRDKVELNLVGHFVVPNPSVYRLPGG